MSPRFEIRRFETIDSTNTWVMDQARDGAAEGLFAVAAEQTAGRGRRGRAWHSPRGGLWMTVLLRPPSGVSVEVLGLRVGLAVAEALGERPALPPIMIKWPNDLMLDDRKIGGVLCEARWQGAIPAWVAVGFGINVQNALPPELQDEAASLGEFDHACTPEMLVVPIATRCAPLANYGPELRATELAEFARRDWLRGRTLLEPAAGVAGGIRPDGALLVHTSDGETEAIRSGHVVLDPRA